MNLTHYGVVSRLEIDGATLFSTGLTDEDFELMEYVRPEDDVLRTDNPASWSGPLN